MRKLLGVLVVLSLTGMDRSLGASSCPLQSFTGTCIQVITYATNPETGECCVYPNPCVVPQGWSTSYNGCLQLCDCWNHPYCRNLHGGDPGAYCDTSAECAKNGANVGLCVPGDA